MDSSLDCTLFRSLIVNHCKAPNDPTRGLPILRNKIARLKAFADQKRDAVSVLVAPYLSPERQELCRNEGVDFIDLSGNVHLHYKSLYIDKCGLPNRFPEKRYGRNPFSDMASLILRAVPEGKEHS